VTGAELRTIRKSLNLNAETWGIALGMTGNGRSRISAVYRLEKMPKIPNWYAVLAEIHKRRGNVPKWILEPAQNSHAKQPSADPN